MHSVHCASSVLGGTAVLSKNLKITIFCVCSSSVLGAVCCFAVVSDNVTFYSDALIINNFERRVSCA